MGIELEIEIGKKEWEGERVEWHVWGWVGGGSLIFICWELSTCSWREKLDKSYAFLGGRTPLRVLCCWFLAGSFAGASCRNTHVGNVEHLCVSSFVPLVCFFSCLSHALFCFFLLSPSVSLFLLS